MTVVRAAALAACMLGSLGSRAARAGSYVFQYVEFPGAKSTYLEGLNDSLAVVGSFTDHALRQHGFTFINGKYNRIDPKGAVSTALYDINRFGLAVGSFRTADGRSMLFTYDTMTGAEVDTPSPFPKLAFGGSSINAAGVIAGTLLTGNLHPLAYVKTARGFRIIPRPPGTYAGYYPTAINDRSVVTVENYHADGFSGGVIYKAGVSTPVNIPGYTDVSLNFINNSGLFGGAVEDAKLNQHGYTVSGGKITFVDYPGSVGNNVAGVTAAGDVIGQWFDKAGGSKGYVLSGGVYHNLDIPAAPAWFVYIYEVRAFGSFIGLATSPAGSRLRSILAVCARDQVPCTQ